MVGICVLNCMLREGSIEFKVTDTDLKKRLDRATYRVFSRDVMAAMLVSQLILWELNSILM